MSNRAEALQLMLEHAAPSSQMLFVEILLDELSRTDARSFKLVSDILNALSRDDSSDEAKVSSLTSLALGGRHRLISHGSAKGSTVASSESDDAVSFKGLKIRTGDNSPVYVGVGDQLSGQAMKAVAAGYEPLVREIESLKSRMSTLELDSQDKHAIEEAAEELLVEVVRETPRKSRVQRGLTVLRGALAQLLTRAGMGAGDATQTWVADTLRALGDQILPN